MNAEKYLIIGGDRKRKREGKGERKVIIFGWKTKIWNLKSI